MKTFIAIHQLLGIDLTNVHPYYADAADAFVEAAQATGAAFRQCWYDEATGFLVCEWAAETADAVRHTLKSIDLPFGDIHEVTHFLPEEMLSLLPSR